MKVEVKIANDYMTAHLLVSLNKGESASNLTKEKLHTEISNTGVNTGVDPNAIKQIISNKIYNQTVCVAKGILPDVGENAWVEILKKPKKKKDITLPKIVDGEIDYYSPREGFLIYARKGDVLAVKHPPTIGKAGKNVIGKTVPGLSGEEISLELFKGENTVIVNNKIIAETDGILELEGLQIKVLKVYEIKDNIGRNTGSVDLPLDLDCTLVIRGDIQRGYKVSCSELYVQGCIEDASVTVNRLEVKRGIIGVSEQKVRADNIKIGYIIGSMEIYSNKIIVLREISNGAKVYSYVVKAYAIQGSTVIARDAIWTNHINGNNSITVGVDYRAKLKHVELSKKILALDDTIDELKTKDFLNTRRLKKLTELARLNPKSTVLKKELPKIKEAKTMLNNLFKIRSELIKKKEKVAEKIYSKNKFFLLSRSNFEKDNYSINMIEPNITIYQRDESQKITMNITLGGLFTIGPYRINHSSKYNIKEIKSQFDNYFNESK